MKTSLVVKNWDDRIVRAALPGEADKEYHSNALYSAPHWAMTSSGFGKAKKKHYPESVYVRNNGFQPKGGKLERVRKLPEPIVESLNLLDVEREKLQALISEINQKERQLLEAAYPESVPLRMHEIRGFKDMGARPAAEA